MTYMPDLTVAGQRIARGNWNFTDDTGDTGAYTIFTVTGDVVLEVFGVCNTTLTGATATIQLGVTGNTAVLIALTTGTDLLANEIWHDTTPTTTVEQIANTTRQFIVTNGQDAILTIATAALTAGDIDFYALWRPLSTDGNVVAA